MTLWIDTQALIVVAISAAIIIVLHIPGVVKRNSKQIPSTTEPEFQKSEN